MFLLGLVVTLMDFSMLSTLLAVLGNAIQINTNEMPWHRCVNSEDGPGKPPFLSNSVRFSKRVMALLCKHIVVGNKISCITFFGFNRRNFSEIPLIRTDKESSVKSLALTRKH